MPKKNKKELNERASLLNQTMKDLNKKYGMDVVHMGIEEKPKERIPFGIKEIDNLLGGGVPCGLFTTIWGPEKSGKTTLAYYLISQAQKIGKTACYIAIEPFDKERAELFGVNLKKLIVLNFPVAEQSLDAIIDLCKKKLVDLIILDSIHSLSPKSEQETKTGKEKSTEDDSMALLARKLSQFFRMAVGHVSRANTALVMIGQARMSVGFIALETLSGGRALKHYSKIIIKISRGQKADSPKEKEVQEDGSKKTVIVGYNCKIKLENTQVSGTATESTEIQLPFKYKSGFNDLLDTNLEEKLSGE